MPRARGYDKEKLNEQLREKLGSDAIKRHWALLLAEMCGGGRAPRELTAAERDRVRGTLEIDREQFDELAELLESVGFGAYAPRRGWRAGHRLRDRLDQVDLALPRAWALRAPFTADTHRRHGADDDDPWGRVKTDRPLRGVDHGVAAAFGGLLLRAGQPPRLECAQRELAYLALGPDRLGGTDLGDVLDALETNCALTISAVLDNKKSGVEERDYAIRDRIIERVEARVGGRFGGQWLPLAEARAAVKGEDERLEQLRIYPTEWARKELARRPVFMSPRSWQSLGSAYQRWLQCAQAMKGTRRGDGIEDLELYFPEGPELRRRRIARGERDAKGRPLRVLRSSAVTFGLEATPHWEVRKIVRHALREIVALDERYTGFGVAEHGLNGDKRTPAFVLHRRRGIQSRPTTRAGVGKADPRRARAERAFRSALKRAADRAQGPRLQDAGYLAALNHATATFLRGHPPPAGAAP